MHVYKYFNKATPIGNISGQLPIREYEISELRIRFLKWVRFHILARNGKGIQYTLLEQLFYLTSLFIVALLLNMYHLPTPQLKWP